MLEIYWAVRLWNTNKQQRFNNIIADEPSPPGKPNIEDWGPNHCDLSWKIPDTDGGAPIIEYQIEYMVGDYWYKRQ